MGGGKRINYPKDIFSPSGGYVNFKKFIFSSTLNQKIGKETQYYFLGCLHLALI
jgi:hypothetical protein